MFICANLNPQTKQRKRWSICKFILDEPDKPGKMCL